MLLVVSTIFALIFLIFAVKYCCDAIKEPEPQLAGNAYLRPAQYFEMGSEVEKLEDAVYAMHSLLVPENNEQDIVPSLYRLKEEYKKFFTDKEGNKRKAIQWVNTAKKIVVEERTSFLTTNGAAVSTFTLDRQNKLTDVILISIAVPILVDAVKKKSSEEVIAGVSKEGFIQSMFSVFIIILAYRIMKYMKNKRSMLRSNRRLVIYQKTELLLDVFIDALEEI